MNRIGRRMLLAGCFGALVATAHAQGSGSGTTGNQGAGPGMMGSGTSPGGMGPGGGGPYGTGPGGMGPGGMGPGGMGPGGMGPGGMGPGGMRGGGPGGMRGGGLGHMTDPAGYLASLEQQLAITPAQKPAWDEYAQTVTGVATQMQGVRETMWQAMPTASWEERQTMMNQMFQARQDSYATVHAAAQKLTEALTPAQRNKAAGLLPGLMPRGRGAPR
ncbi:MAG: Spy/CpxP family protein refolding chaperone [Rhodospirillales bacterium]|nr:Spy/CpxP family protein refolding chaperone [Rhodospirillales bacterium]